MAAFFHAMAPTLTANLLTVTFVYCCAKVAQSERRGEEGRLTYLWLMALVLMFMLYGFYTWKNPECCREIPSEASGTPAVQMFNPDPK
jgi:hypothetical protein